MKHLNFSPVVMLILGVVPFLLMIVQWVTEDIMGIGRVIDHMTRWETMFQVGIEMSLLGVILWGIDAISKWYRRMKLKKVVSDFYQLQDKIFPKNYKDIWEREYLCQPPFDEEMQGGINKNKECSGRPGLISALGAEIKTDHGTVILHRLPTYSNQVFPFGKDVCGKILKWKN